LPGAEPLHAEALQRFRDLAAPLIAALSPQLPSPVAPAVAQGTAAGTAAAGTAAQNATPAARAGEPPSKAVN
jgi:hypothetical protein